MPLLASGHPACDADRTLPEVQNLTSQRRAAGVQPDPGAKMVEERLESAGSGWKTASEQFLLVSVPAQQRGPAGCNAS